MKKQMLSILRRNGNKDVVVKLSCFPTRFLCGVSRFFISDEWSSVRNKIGRCRIKCGKTPNLMGFTLIELLVVVLIIGILAAVAVPQYQNVVWKSRGTQLYVAVQALHAGQKAYYLANGTWATTFDELSIEIPFKNACTGGGVGANGYTDHTHTDCQSNKYGFIYIAGNGASYAVFRSDSPKYRWSGFMIPESETSSRQDELICTDIGNGKKAFCALMGYTSKISCNNQSVCLYSK